MENVSKFYAPHLDELYPRFLSVDDVDLPDQTSPVDVPVERLTQDDVPVVDATEILEDAADIMTAAKTA